MASTPMKDLEDIKLHLREFVAERDWQQFHSSKNIAMALMVEAAEILEHFQWLTPAQSDNLEPAVKQQVADEIADVLVYLVRLADAQDINIMDAVNSKMAINAAKYPADLVRGKADKYTRYQQSTPDAESSAKS
jgi:dCTP diphosphatase